MDIGFFVSYNNQVVQLPVNPEKVAVSMKGNNSTTEIIKLGQINLIKGRKLTEISFSSFFPEDDWFPAVRTRGEFKKPEFYKNFFETIQLDEKPCRLVITGIGITMKCSVENFEYYHQGGDHEDAYYSLDLKEYRDYQVTQIGVDASLLRNYTASTSSIPAPAKAVTPSKITKGCTVILNGTVHQDSYGTNPGKTFRNYSCKVNLINANAPYPYHITTPSGGWLGWASEESVVLA